MYNLTGKSRDYFPQSLMQSFDVLFLLYAEQNMQMCFSAI